MHWQTAAGLAAGLVIMAIGAASLVMNLGPTTVNEDLAIVPGEEVAYRIPAPAGSAQQMSITGDSFVVELSSPGGLQIPESSREGRADLEWVHEEDGESLVRIMNSGSSDIEVRGALVRGVEAIWITYDLMVMTSGVIIIGLSLGFRMRRPAGF